MSDGTLPVDAAKDVMVMLVGYGTAAVMGATGRFFEAAVVYLLTSIWCELALNSEGGDAGGE